MMNMMKTKDKEFMTPRIKYFVLLPLVLVITVFLLVISIFSMFMSNTATAAMMLALLTPILASMPADDPGKGALALSIPLAANLGGIGTPIGTPPNAIADSTGLIRSRDMARIGLLIGIIGFVFGFVWMTELFPF